MATNIYSHLGQDLPNKKLQVPAPSLLAGLIEVKRGVLSAEVTHH